MFTPSLYQSKEKEIISDLRKSNLPLASCFILGLPAAHVLCRLFSQTERQHRELWRVIQRNKAEANTCSSISMQTIQKGAISSSSTLTSGSDHHFSSTVPSQHCFTPTHLTHISSYILEKPRNSNSSQELCHLTSLGFIKAFCTWRQEGERCA